MGQIQEEEVQGERIPVTYCRTSSETQKNSLKNQIERMKKEVSQREGMSEEEVVVYQDNQSAYSDRKSLNRLCEDLISGKISKVYILWEDRLSRSPCLTRLLESLAHNRGVEIICIEPECNDEDELATAMTECLHLLNIVINKKNGRRGGAKVKVNMPDKVLALCYEMYRDGCSIRQIEAELKSRKIRDDKGHWYKRGVIQNRISENLKALRAVHGDEPTNSFQKFCQLYVKKSRGHKKLARASIARAYQAYIAKTGAMSVSQSTITKTLQKMFGVEGEFGTWTNDRRVFYPGLVLTTNKGNQK